MNAIKSIQSLKINVRTDGQFSTPRKSMPHTTRMSLNNWERQQEPELRKSASQEKESFGSWLMQKLSGTSPRQSAEAKDLEKIQASERAPHKEVCKSCTTQFQDNQAKFCGVCGQKRKK